MPGRVVIAGGNGFIGSALAPHLASKGYEVVLLVRELSARTDFRESLWDGKTVGAWANDLNESVAVINLSGASVSKHWSEDRKLRILQSRVDSTEAIGKAILGCEAPPRVWLNASATGYYGNRFDEVLSERAGPGRKGDFLVDTCVAWEYTCERFDLPNTRKAWLRTGIVLGRGSGAFEPLRKITKFFLGGQIGNGQQFISWIHIEDLNRMYAWAVEAEVSGAINATAPDPVRNAFFMATLRAVLNRPWSPPVPAFLLKLVGALGGPEASLLLEGQQVMPEVAKEHGFEFRYPVLRDALVSLAQ